MRGTAASRTSKRSAKPPMSTAHAHIKHIYEKTGIHSRQEILDYLEEYGS